MTPALSMPLYVSPSDVILRMQLNAALDGVIQVVSQAIMSAELMVQGLLDGNFIRQSQDCMFQLDSQAFSGIQPGGLFRVELPAPVNLAMIMCTITSFGMPKGSRLLLDVSLMSILTR